MQVHPISATLSGLSLSTYSEDEMRRLSVCQIISERGIDQVGFPMRGGYYDPAMGPKATYDVCETCGLHWKSCPGHMGHIELPVYCYNHFFFPTVFKLYRLVCHSCHRFLITDFQALVLETGLLLLDAGYVGDVHHIFGLLSYTSNVSVSQILGDLRKKAYDYLSRNRPCAPTANILLMKNKLKLFFLQLRAPNACPHCATPCVSVIRRGTYNIYLVPIKRRPAKKPAKKPTDKRRELNELKKDIDQSEQPLEDTEAPTTKHVVIDDTLYCAPIMVLKELSAAVAMNRHLLDLLFSDIHYWGTGPTPSLVGENYTSEYVEVRSVAMKNILGIIGQSLDFPSYRKEFTPRAMFIKALLVPPNRQRPSVVLNNAFVDHPMNTHLLNILVLCNSFSTLGKQVDLADFVSKHTDDDVNVRANSLNIQQFNELDKMGGVGIPIKTRAALTTDLTSIRQHMKDLQEKTKPLPFALIDNMISLQTFVSRYLDGTAVSATSYTKGIRQLLEKKEGLFRMNIMGKRGNYAGRSVIAPDANLDTDEIGLPVYFATKLTFPEPIGSHNVDFMAKLIINGPTYPGASVLIDESGSKILLSALSYEQRKALAQILLIDFSKDAAAIVMQEDSDDIEARSNLAAPKALEIRSYDLNGTPATFKGSLKPPKILLRHTLPNDFVILNRQPTLHKHSMIALRVRILPSNAQAIRFHFASCNGLNADFDGDECCVLKPQTYEAASEYANLVHADSHFISVTSGEPIRGLIQDHVIGGIFLCAVGTFLDLGTVCEYIMVATGSSKLSSFEQSLGGCNLKERLLGLDIISKQKSAENVFSSLNEMKYMGMIRNRKIVRAKNDINDAFGKKYDTSLTSMECSFLGTKPAVDVPRPPSSFFEDYVPPSIDVEAAPDKYEVHSGFHTQANMPGEHVRKETNAFTTQKVTILPDSCLLNKENEDFMSVPQPSIMYPAPRWTGKAVITSMLRKVSCRKSLLNYVGSVKVPTEIWGPFRTTEDKVVIIDNVLLTGIIDKQHISTTPHGLAHAIFELYGHSRCGWFLSNFGRLATHVLQKHGFTCSVEDMILSDAAEQARQKLCESTLGMGSIKAAEFLCEYLTATGLLGSFSNDDIGFLMRFSKKGSIGLDNFTQEDRSRVYTVLRTAFNLDKTIEGRLDNYISSEASNITTALMKTCNPSNLVLKMHSALSANNPYGFQNLRSRGSHNECPLNMLSLKSVNSLAYMVLSGAKGSIVNLQMMTTCLGQQNLEGRRVPSTATGKTLPSHIPYEHCEFIQGGYVVDRFLTGIRPSSFFFHCQAGREGLIDTAIKTATSGYFQRVLIKNLEGLSVAYDGTVRSTDNSLVQLLYGGDGIDTSKTSYLQSFEFINWNQQLYLDRFLPDLRYDSRYLADSDKVSSLLRSIHLDMKNGNPVPSDLQALRILYEQYAGSSSYISLPSLVKNAEHLAAILQERHNEHSENLERAQRLVLNLNAKACESVSKYLSTYKKALHEANLMAETTILQPTQKERDKLVKYLKAIYMPNSSKHDKDIVFDTMTVTDLADLYNYFQNVPIHMVLSPYTCLGSTPPSFSEALDKYIGEKVEESKKEWKPEFDPAYFRLLAYTKFIRSLISPGSAVGIIAAQSTGEPSTQLTLNTFHLAGYGGVNATMGVPRLREIIMTKNTSSPIITVPFKKTCDISVQKNGTLHRKTLRLDSEENLKVCKDLQQQLRKIYLRDILRSYILKETQDNDGGVRYELTMKLLTLFDLSQEYNFNPGVLKKLFALVIAKHLSRVLTKEISSHKEMTTVRSSSFSDKDFIEYTEKTSSYAKVTVDDDGDEGKQMECDEKSSVDDSSSSESSDSAQSQSMSDPEASKQDPDKSDDDDEGLMSVDLDALSNKESSTYADEGALNVIRTSTQISAKEREFLTEWALTDSSKLLDTAMKAVNTAYITLKGIVFTLEDSALDIPPNKMPLAVRLTMQNSEPSHVLALATVERAINSIVLKEVRGITQCFTRHVPANNSYVMDIEGGNLRALFYLTSPFIDLSNVYTNNINQIFELYGIEAARNAILEEIHRVFSTYHINVDERHLSLIADFMTTSGAVQCLSRTGICNQPEELLKASFESACSFIASGAINNGSDSLRAPAGAITVGQYPSMGTGSFELLSVL